MQVTALTSNEPALRHVAPADPAAPHLAEQWARVRGRLQQDVGELEYRSWLRQMTLAAVDGEEVTITLPTRFLCDWVRSHYADKIDALWRQENPAVRRVDLRVAPQAAPAPLAGAVAEAAEPVLEPLAAVAPRTRAEERGEARNELYASLDPRFSFEAFVVGKPNEFAYACARRVAERPASPEFNPLFLYGGVGLGKTHWMANGHYRSGMTIFIGAYVVSIFVCERILHAGKEQLLTIPWFAWCYNWVMALKDALLGWFKQTAVWRTAVALKDKVRAMMRRTSDRLRLLFGYRPKPVEPRLTPTAERR